MENGWGFGSLHVLINDPRVILYIQQAMYNPVGLQKNFILFVKLFCLINIHFSPLCSFFALSSGLAWVARSACRNT